MRIEPSRASIPLLSMLVSLAAPPHPSPAAEEGKLRVELIGQSETLWCWAASGEMVMKFLGNDVSQCEQAERRYGPANCCGNPGSATCNQPGFPEFEKFGFTCKKTSGAALSWDQVKGQISAKTPFAFSWRYKGTASSGHMMVATGYLKVGSDRCVSINDPALSDIDQISYDAYVSGVHYDHWDDFYDVTKRAGAAPAGAPRDAPPCGEIARVGGHEAHMASRPMAVALAESRPVAERGLESSRKLHAVDGKAFPANAALGKPFPVVMILLDPLLAAKTDEERQGLVRPDISMVIYPVVAGDRILSSITTQLAAGGWKVAWFGRGSLEKRLAGARTVHAKANRLDPSSYYVVSIPALNLYFLTWDGEGEKMLIPVTDDPRHDWKTGRGMKARAVIPELIEAARRLNGLPG